MKTAIDELNDLRVEVNSLWHRATNLISKCDDFPSQEKWARFNAIFETITHLYEAKKALDKV